MLVMCSDDERSACYEALLIAEEKGKKEKKGLHSARDPPVQHVNDLTLPGSANKCACNATTAAHCPYHLSCQSTPACCRPISHLVNKGWFGGPFCI